MTYLTSVGSGVADAGATTFDSDVITISGTNKVLYVAVGSSDGAPIAPSNVVYDPAGVNQALTLIGSATTYGTFGCFSIWRLIAPTDGVSKIVRATWASTQGERLVLPWLEVDIDQVTPNGTPTEGTGSGTGAGMAVNIGALTTTIGQRLLMFAHTIDTGTMAGPPFGSATGTERHDFVTTGTAYDAMAAQEQTASTVSTTPTWALAEDTTGWAAKAFVLNVASGGGPPTITLQPEGKSGAVGQSVQYSVAATGGTLSYQWQFSTDQGDTWSNVTLGSGGTTDTYTTPTLLDSYNGYKYRCRVTDENGTTDSLGVYLHVSGLLTGKSRKISYSALFARTENRFGLFRGLSPNLLQKSELYTNRDIAASLNDFFFAPDTGATFSGSLTAQSAVTGALTNGINLSASLSAVSNVTGDLVVPQIIVFPNRTIASNRNRPGIGPYSVGDKFFVKDTRKFGPTTAPSDTTLSGSLISVSSVSADLTTQILLSESSSSVSSVTGALTTQITLSGALASVSVVTGLISTQVNLSGSLASVSAVTGAITTGINLTGSLSGVESVIGAINTGILLSGSLSNVSSVTGDLTNAITLEGALASVSSVTGDLNVGSVASLSGNLVSVSSVTGFLTTDIHLSGALSTVSSVSGSISTQINVSGSLSSVSSVSANLSTDITVSGSLVSIETVSADLSTGINLSGNLVAESSITASLANNQLGGSLSSVSAVSGSLTTLIQVSGQVSGQSNVTGSLTTEIQLSGAVSDVSGVSGNISTGIELSGSLSSASSVSGTLSGSATLISGAIVANSSVSGNLLTSVQMAAAVSSESSVSGDLQTGQLLSGALQNTSGVSANLSTQITLAMNAQCNSSVTGALSTSIRLASNIGAQSNVFANLFAPSSSSYDAGRMLNILF